MVIVSLCLHMVCPPAVSMSQFPLLIRTQVTLGLGFQHMDFSGSHSSLHYGSAQSCELMGTFELSLFALRWLLLGLWEPLMVPRNAGG